MRRLIRVRGQEGYLRESPATKTDTPQSIKFKPSRRKFLHTATAGFASSATGLPYFGSNTKRIGRWIFNFDSHTIRYIGTEKISGQSIYSHFKDLWMNDPDLICYSFPCTAVTREMFFFDIDWRLEDTVFPCIVDTSILNGDDIWQGIKIIGSWTQDFRIHRDELPDPIVTNEESFCYRADQETSQISLIQAAHGIHYSRFDVDMRNQRGFGSPVYMPLCEVIDREW